MSPTEPHDPAVRAGLRADRDRFVALAFSWGDILLELDDAGRIAFAVGATEALAGRKAAEMLGRPLTELVASMDQQLVEDLLSAARRGDRTDGAALRLANYGRLSPPLTFSGYRLQDLNGHYFVALRHSPTAQRQSGFGRRIRDETSGLYDARSFTDMVTRQLMAPPVAGEQQISLVRLENYQALSERLDNDGNGALQANVGAVLRDNSIDSDAAARLGSDRYGLVHRPDLDIGRIESEIADMTREADPLAEGCGVSAATIVIDRDEMPGDDLARGLKYALNRFQGGNEDLALLNGPLSKLTRIATASAGQLRAIVVDGKFGLAFQPVVNIRNGQIHYYEATIDLPAGPGSISAEEVVAFAVATDAIAAFDLTMLRKVVDWLKTKTSINGKTIVAVNLCGRSLGALSFVAQIDRLLKENAWLRGRLLFEISEIWRLPDTSAAELFIRRLREKSFLVCLDRFEVGARGFRQLIDSDIDVAKVAAGDLNAARQSHKGKALLRSMVGLCRELGVATVAGGINDDDGFKFARDCGIQFVQGDLFGMPAADLKAFAKSIPAHLFATKPAEVAKRA